MKRLVILALTLATAVCLFGACGNSSANVAPASSSKPAAAAPAATATPTPTPSPTPTPIPYTPNVLTGLEQNAGDPAVGQRITAVMVNNISNTSSQNARPQRGISEAKILMECKVEGGITRLCAIFDDVASIPEIGPIRSGRDQFLRTIMPWNALYYHEGESVFTTEYIRDYDYCGLNIGGKQYPESNVTVPLTQPGKGHRDNRGRDVAYEHTLFTSGEEIQSVIDKNNIDMSRTYNSTFFDFVPYYEDDRDLNGDSAVNVSVRHSSSYRTYFDFNEAESKYYMSMYSSAAGGVKPTIDENNGKQLSFDNLVVLFTEIETYPGDSHGIQYVDMTYGGVGYYFCNGKCEYIRWQKGTPLETLRLFTGDGSETSLKVNPGTTYLTYVDLDEYDGFHYEGNGQEAVQEDDFEANNFEDNNAD